MAKRTNVTIIQPKIQSCVLKSWILGFWKVDVSEHPPVLLDCFWILKQASAEELLAFLLSYIDISNILIVWLTDFALSRGQRVLSCSVVSSSLRHCGLYPTRLLYPWDFPGRNTGVGCHILLQGSSRPRDETPISCVSCTGRQILYHWATWEAHRGH